MFWFRCPKSGASPPDDSQIVRVGCGRGRNDNATGRAAGFGTAWTNVGEDAGF